MTEELYDVGKIVNTHGIIGEIRVIRITDFEERFKPGGTLYLVKDNEQHRKLTIASHRKHKQFDLLKFDGLNDINDVESFKGAHLKVAKEDLTELPEGEYYYYELIGCEVFTIEGEKIGVIKEVLSPGANDVWVVQRAGEKDALLPFIKDVVKDVNIQDKKIVVELMEGLLD